MKIEIMLRIQTVKQKTTLIKEHLRSSKRKKWDTITYSESPNLRRLPVETPSDRVCSLSQELTTTLSQFEIENTHKNTV